MALKKSVTFSESHNASTGISLAGYLGANWGQNWSQATTYTSKGLADWNGDGIIDFNYPNAVRLGGLDETIKFRSDCHVALGNVCLLRPGVREAVNYTFGSNTQVSGRFADMLMRALGVEPTGPLIAAALSSQSYGISTQGAHSATLSNRIDINGDGLPDLVASAIGDDLTSLKRGEPIPDDLDTHIVAQLNLGYDLGKFTSFGVLEDYKPEGTGLATAVKLGPERTWLPDFLLKAALAEADTLKIGETFGVSGGYSAGIVGGGASFSYNDSVSTSQTARLIADVNGDGLADIIAKAPGNDRIDLWLNTGRFFGLASETSDNTSLFQAFSGPEGMASEDWIEGKGPRLAKAFVLFSQVDAILEDVGVNLPFQPSGDLDLAGSLDSLIEGSSKSETWSGSANVTVFFVNVSASYAHSKSDRAQQLLLQDVDGDGLPDRILRSEEEDDGAIQVQRNLMGGGNLLKTIHRPLGGRIELKYERHTPSEADPNTRWLVTNVVISNDDSNPAVHDREFTSRFYSRMATKNHITTASSENSMVLEEWLKSVVMESSQSPITITATIG